MVFAALAGRAADRVVDRLQTEARGIYLLWSEGQPDAERILELPFVVGGQTTVQWAEVAPRPGVYDFSALDEKLERFARSGRWCTLQINGNQKPVWLFAEVPSVPQKLSHQERTRQGSLMYWHPRFQQAYGEMLAAAGRHMAQSPWRGRLLGIRLNFDALGTEQMDVPPAFQPAAAWKFPAGVARAGVPDFSSAVEDAYARRVLAEYRQAFGTQMVVFMRNEARSPALLTAASAEYATGRLGLFHTSSEVEPRTHNTEPRYGLFYDYARSGQTVAYAEPWASAWGEHGGKQDVRWCSPCQWNYWTLLFDLHCGVSFIGDYYQDLRAAAQGDRQFLDAYTWTARYVGRHNRPAEAPGAWVAFRHNDEIKARNLPAAPAEVWHLSRFNDDYTFLMRRLPGDHSLGVGPVGPPTERYGAFARQIAPGDTVRLELDPDFRRTLHSGTVRLILLDDGRHGTVIVRCGERVLGRAAAMTGGHWRVAEFPLPSEATSSDFTLSVTGGPATVHLLEVRR